MTDETGHVITTNNFLFIFLTKSFMIFSKQTHKEYTFLDAKFGNFITGDLDKNGKSEFNLIVFKI